ncbi:MAG: response regulator [Bacteroidota bacterium]
MRNENSLSHDPPEILVVDDRPDNLKVLGDILKGEGYKVRPVTTGAFALQVAAKEKPDLVLLDIMMPGLDGFEVCSRLKADPELKDVPIIFISALNETSDIVRALSVGGADYITKPFQTEEVKARVRTQLSLYRQNMELKALMASKDKFFSIIAHDLRSPFTAFLGLTKMMVTEVKHLSSEEIEGIAGMLNKSATNLYGLLDNLLQWSLVQRGIISFSPEPFFLKNKVFDCITTLFDATRNKEISVDMNIPDHILIVADVHMFETIVRNLYSNAVKFTARGGEIFISVVVNKNNFLEISIRDTGIGMPAQLVNRLFLPNEPTGRKGTEGEPSSGLGLILCKEFVEKHGGRIMAESVEGAGSTISFTIPYSPVSRFKKMTKKQGETVENSMTIKNLKILIAEDDEGTGSLIAQALKTFGPHVYKTGTGTEAVALCRNHPDIDIVLMDINMPEMDGYEATRQIRQFNQNVIIIAQTTNALEGVRQKALKAGCDDYIVKPYGKGLLTALIKLHVEKHKRRIRGIV